MRRAFTAGVVLLLVMVGAWYACQRAQLPYPPPRNLILISIDTLRADHLGVYGYEHDTSPHIDQLARRSTVFTQAVAQAPNTPPSHASLLTSLYYSVHRFSGNGDRIPEWRTTLADLLRAQGFATWGFVDGGYLRGVFGFDQGFEHYEDRQAGIAVILKNVEHWLDGHSPHRFFLFLHCYDVHSPYAPPPPFDTLFEDTPYAGDFVPTTKNLEDVAQWHREIKPEDLRHVIALYDGGIRYTDEQLGRFFESLRRRDLLDSTLIVITSDHGEEFLEHGSMLHWQTYFMPILHVPLIFYVPGRPGQTIDGPVELIDVVPTVLELLGLPPWPEAMGRSLAPWIEGRRPADLDRLAYAEPFLLTLANRTVISHRYQLFYNTRTGNKRLFDIRSDPGAKTDLVSHSQAVASRLFAGIKHREQRIDEANRRSRHPATEATAPGKAVREELKALGYLGD